MKYIIFILTIGIASLSCNQFFEFKNAKKYDTILVNNKPILVELISRDEFYKNYHKVKFDTSESINIAKNNEFVKRIKDTLLISTKDSFFNKKIVSKWGKENDSSVEVIVYIFNKNFSVLNFWAIDVQFYCGGVGLLINKKTGKSFFVEPSPIESPDGSRFLTPTYLMGEGSINLYKSIDDTIALTHSIWHSKFQLDSVGWVNNDEIVFSTMKSSENKQKYFRFKIRN
ncbi:MAG: hypothetical protein RJA07_731 [Bacteroidota bacterium]|jgi:hypothetical protein